MLKPSRTIFRFHKLSARTFVTYLEFTDPLVEKHESSGQMDKEEGSGGRKKEEGRTKNEGGGRHKEEGRRKTEEGGRSDARKEKGCGRKRKRK